MTDESLRKPPVAVELGDLDLLRRELIALRATQAPVVYFDVISSQGVQSGIGNITLECGMHMIVDGALANERQVVAHLRFPLSCLPYIREALDKIEFLAKPPASAEKN